MAVDLSEIKTMNVMKEVRMITTRKISSQNTNLFFEKKFMARGLIIFKKCFFINEIRYRKSDGGNCNYGNWEEWQDEDAALEFMLGPIDVIPTMRAHAYVALSLLPDLKEVELNQHGVLADTDQINYGRY